jgi:aspartyl-tRNA(Asn)/glutamyl-tRNA(Gln) amidotransferase subunit A
VSTATTPSRDRLERCLARIADPTYEGARAFTKVYAETARAEADYSDALHRAGVVRSPIDGLPVSVKDLFDVGGDITRAGSKVLSNAAPAERDATAVARLRAAGAVIIGRTNMVEFAFGVVGANPHYGTPKNPFDRAVGRVPGGSSSGAAVALADDLCAMSLGSDTRGSIRIPAALCGVTGFKPTTRRVPRDGAFPLSYTLDSVGPLSDSVEQCALFDAVLAVQPATPLPDIPARGLRLLLPRSSVLEDLDAHVANAFDAALETLAWTGTTIVDVPMPMFDRQADYFRGGGIAGAEAYAIHRSRLERLAEYDPRVGKRIVLAKDMSGADYVEITRLRSAFIADVEAAAAQYDAIVMPTTPCIAPTIAEATANDDDYFRWNARIFRNAGLINFLDGCAVSLPCHAPGTAPVGLSVCGVAMSDRHTLAVARAVEAAIADR